MYVKLFLLVALVAVVMSAPTENLLLDPVDAQQEWTNWKTKHNKTYAPDEDAKRFEIFQENLKKITEHNKKYNAGEVTWTQGLNQFADLTQKEFAATHLGARRPPTDGSVGGVF